MKWIAVISCHFLIMNKKIITYIYIKIRNFPVFPAEVDAVHNSSQ